MGKMFRVLSADDEYWSRESIRSLINWSEYNIEFLEPACDGEEVLERLQSEHVDILLTDINMPFLSGLELMERVKVEYPEVITIVISGYDDFVKVKSSFKSGGIDYLLKPVGQEELVETLTKAFSILEEREHQLNQENVNKENDLKISSYLEDNEYSALLNKKLYDGAENSGFVPSGNEFTDVSMILIKFYDIIQASQKYDNDVFKMSYSIKNMIKDTLPYNKECILFNYTSKMSEYILILPFEHAVSDFIARNILKRFTNDEYGPISVAVNDALGSLDDIGKRYREAIVESVSRPFDKESYILKCGKVLKQTRISKYIGKEATDELVFALSTGNKDVARRLIIEQSSFEECMKKGWSFIEVKQFINRVRNILLDNFMREKKEKLSEAENIVDSMEHYLENLNYEGIKECLDALLDEFFADSKSCVSDTMGGQIEDVQRYIEDNYNANLTLSFLSEQFHIEASYLSRLFSQKYGETITSYITTTRMEHAKEMVKDKNKKLETISFLLGYDDYNYFSRVFKKKVGMSPSEYRKQIAS